MEQIEKMYERQKRGRMKAAIVCVIVYFLMIGIVSLFYGNPFPHKEMVLFFEMEQSGWIFTHGYLLLFCGIIGLAAGIGSVIYRVMNDYRALDRILLEECDAEKYLEVGWKGNKNTRLYKQTVMNFNLIQCYMTGNKVGLQEIYIKAGKIFKENKLFIAEKLFLEEQYEEAAGILSNYKEKKLYNEVSRNYLLGRCYDRLGDIKMAWECMKYTVEHGNTMPCKEKAEEWLGISPIKF